MSPDERNVDVHLVVSYSPVSRQFTLERQLGPIFFDGKQVFNPNQRRYERNDEPGNLPLISDASDQLESALRVINTVPSRA